MSDLREVDGELVTTWGEVFGTTPDLLTAPSDPDTCLPERRGVSGQVFLICDQEVGHCEFSGDPCNNNDECEPGEECVFVVEPGSRGFEYDSTDCNSFVFTNPGGSTGGIQIDYTLNIIGCVALPGGSDDVDDGDYVQAYIAANLAREDGTGGTISIPVTSVTGIFSLGSPAAYNGFFGEGVLKTGGTLLNVTGEGQAFLSYIDQSNPGGEYWEPGCRYRITWSVYLKTYKADSSPGNYAIELVDPDIPVIFHVEMSPGCLPVEAHCELPA